MLIHLDTYHLPEAESLFRDVFSGEPWNDDWSDPERLRAYMCDLTGSVNSLSLGFIIGGKLSAISLGHVFNWWQGREYHIREFCVARDLQRTGIGTAFLNEIVTLIRANGMKSVFLATARGLPAFDFYIRNGFHELSGMAFLAKDIR